MTSVRHLESTMPITIGPAVVSDIPALSDLIGELFAIEPDFAIDRTKQAKGLRLLLDRPDTALVLTARTTKNDYPVGMITVQLVVSTAEGGLSALVEDVVVLAPWRDQGLGTRLLETAMTWARNKGASRVQLLTDRENTSALRFYEKRGFSLSRMVNYRKPLR